MKTLGLLTLGYTLGLGTVAVPLALLLRRPTLR